MITKMQNLIPKLVFSVLITTVVVTTFSLSKYESAMAGSSNVTVASFIIDSTGSDIDNLSIDCNNDAPTVSYDVVVTNKKDNAIVVEFSEALPTGLTLTDGTTTIDSVDGQTSYVFSDIGNFSADIEKSNTHTITLTGSNEVLSAYNGTMSIYVDATQID